MLKLWFVFSFSQVLTVFAPLKRYHRQLGYVLLQEIILFSNLTSEEIVSTSVKIVCCLFISASGVGRFNIVKWPHHHLVQKGIRGTNLHNVTK